MDKELGYCIKKITRKKSTPVKSKKFKKDWNTTSRYDSNCRKPYWDLSSRNKQISIPSSNSKKVALQQKLKRFISTNSEKISKDDLARIKRLYRKLVVRQAKEYLRINQLPNIPSRSESGMLSSSKAYREDFIKCSFTNRILTPVIFQDFEVEPPLLKLHSELRNKVREKFPNLHVPEIKQRHPINYLYVNKDHIPVINALVKLHFWDGIDTSIALRYPEFSCVVTYRKIVIGFGFIAPGNHLNEAYINFLLVRPKWRKCGIGQMILYHLIQSCKTWDITLHVSPTNHSLMMYQKFGFKHNALLQHFYELYMQNKSNESTHSFFMKLEHADFKPK